MILGKLHLGETSLHTHRDSYVLETISAISTRRPFLSAGAMITVLTTGFGWSFADILTTGELLALSLVSLSSLAGGVGIGQLHLVSRDLRGSPIGDAVYGTYRHLNHERLSITEAVERTKAGGGS